MNVEKIGAPSDCNSLKRSPEIKTSSLCSYTPIPAPPQGDYRQRVARRPADQRETRRAVLNARAAQIAEGLSRDHARMASRAILPAEKAELSALAAGFMAFAGLSLGVAR